MWYFCSVFQIMSDNSNILVLRSQIIGRPTSTQELSNVLWSVLIFLQVECLCPNLVTSNCVECHLCCLNGNTKWTSIVKCHMNVRGRRGRDRMVVGFIASMQLVYITINVVSSNPAHARYTRYNICDKGCQWLAAGRWFSLGTPVSSTNKTDRHDIVEISLNVALSTITHPTQSPNGFSCLA